MEDLIWHPGTSTTIRGLTTRGSDSARVFSFEFISEFTNLESRLAAGGFSFSKQRSSGSFERRIETDLSTYERGRKVLVLTERTEHLDAIKTALDGQVPAPFVLHGRMSKKQRAALIAELQALPPDAPRVLLATGKLVGEGFDHPPDPGQASRAALRTLPLGLARPAHQARVVRFMDVSGLRPYGRRWEFKLRDIAPSLVPLADHPMLRRDSDGGLVVTVEPYADVGDGIHYALEAWARYRGWQYQVTDARAAMRNPDMGRPSKLLAPHRESPRWRQTSYPGHWHSG